ncbi:conserved hypothetical protein [Shewanella sp. MR-4]|nr:conserved hypothetical protein [Shewanella sp. MR-4]
MNMNNTKWRECLSILAALRVYLQLHLVGDADFPMDYEAAHQVISQIDTRDFVFVRKTISYKDIAALRIVKDTFPAAETQSSNQASVLLFAAELAELRRKLMQLGQLPLTEDDESILITAY